MVNYRNHLTTEFKSYTDGYDSTDPKIQLKIDHTYRVAALCEEIAQSIGMDENDVRLAWTCGMLHDIGRFEQVKRYGTFFDGQSVDHAQFGADLLFKEDLYERFVPKSSYIDERNQPEVSETTIPGEICEYESDRLLIEKAIRVHNMFRMPELSEREKRFADILRDADKIDILRVNCETPTEDVYNVTTETLKNAEVSEDAMRAFKERRCAKRHERMTAVDYLVGHICLTFELVYDRSLHLMFEQGYLYRLMEFESENAKTNEWFAYMRGEMHKMEEEINKKSE